MAIYLDTSTIRRYSKALVEGTFVAEETNGTKGSDGATGLDTGTEVATDVEHTLFTSSLAVFELMSGIKARTTSELTELTTPTDLKENCNNGSHNEKENGKDAEKEDRGENGDNGKDTDYNVRRAAVKRLLECEKRGIVRIDWDSYKAKMFHAFLFNYYDEEGQAIKELAEAFVTCDSFEEFEKVRVCETLSPVDGGTDFYTFESLKDLDEQIVEIGRVTSKLAQTKEWRQIEKKARQEGKQKILEWFPAYTNKLAELTVIPIAEDFANSPRPSEKYFEIVGRYDRSLQLCFQYQNAIFLLAEMEGGTTQKNDIFDMMHLLYLKDGDTIIAEDKVFKKVNALIGRIKVLNWEEFSTRD